MGRGNSGRLVFYGLVLPAAMGLCAWQGWSWWSWANHHLPLTAVAEGTDENPEDAVVITVPDGTSAQGIGALLVEADAIRSGIAWDMMTRWQSWLGDGNGFLAGTYAIAPNESMTAIADKLRQGSVITTRFTIPEGWAIAQMAQYFEELGWFTADEFMAAAQGVDRDRYPWLPAETRTNQGSNLEGFLYPSTYYIAENPTAPMVINQMLGQFEQTVLPIYAQGQGQTPYSLMEWVTLGSIVEREAVVPDERPTIAAVFARRLREGIPLATDPTVEYAFGIQQTPDRPLTYAEVGTPHPYNTYINVGLPPGPIAAPGLDSLQASLNPGDTEYLFFMARFDGTHIFSRTLAQHEAARDRVGARIKAGERPWEESR